MSKTVQCFMLGARRLDKGVKQANHNKDNRYALKKQLSREEWGTGGDGGEERRGETEKGKRKSVIVKHSPQAHVLQLWNRFERS